MTTLVTGVSGQLGRAFKEKIVKNVVFADKATCDLSDAKILQRQLDRIRPTTIINCAAYTAVDEAESRPELAFRINSDAVGEISAWCSKEGARLVHFSTDYVFDGEKQTKYTEKDTPNPLSVYGKSKRDGEKKFLDSGCKGFCLRTSWLHSGHGNNFFLTMIKLLATKEDVHVVNDQIGVPTTAAFLVDMTLELLRLNGEDEQPGTILHACPSGQATWYDFAIHIQARMLREDIHLTCQNITPVSSDQFTQDAPRPRLSALSNRLAASKVAAFDIPWQKATDNIGLENDFWNI